MSLHERMRTAREVAEVADVSISTVGRALADDPRISHDTKEKVRRAAASIGYVSNLPARMMRGGASNLIGLMLPDVRNDFYAGIAQELSCTCDREGFRIVLAITGDDRELEVRHIRDLSSARAAGLIIVPTASPKRESLQMLRGLRHVQLLRNVPSIEGSWFGIDDEVALGKATEHLLSLGHRRIAYIGGQETLSTGAARVKGYRRALSARSGLDIESAECLGSPIVDFGARALSDLMAGARPPTAIVTGSAHIAIGVVEAVETKAISVPTDLSVIGFGDPQWFSWWRGGLSTVRPPIEELAAACGLWFMRLLQATPRPQPSEPYSSVTTSQFVRRQSTAPPHADLEAGRSRKTTRPGSRQRRSAIRT